MKTRSFFLIASLLIISIFLFYVAVYFIEKSTINKLANQKLNEKAVEKIEYFNKFIKQKTSLLGALSSNKNFISFVKGEENKSSIENTFLSFSNFNSDIYQLRYIDKNGNEILRVNNKGKVEVAKEEKLQNKKGRYYFEDTMKLSKDKYFFSNIDLNMEHGKIEKPIVPTLRVSTPIIIDGMKYGILIININMNEFLTKLKETELHYINLIYDDKNIIVSSNSDYNWSRDYDIDVPFSQLFPTLPLNYYQFDGTRTKNYLLKKLDIDTKNKIFILLFPKKLEIYDLFYKDKTKELTYLILLLLCTLPISYLISSYIEKSYQKASEIKEELNRLRVAIEHAPISVVMTDKEGNINYVNPHFSTVTGYSFEEAVGSNPRILKSEETSSEEYFELWETLKAKKVWRGTFKNIRKDSSEFWESVIITPILDDNGEISNFLAIKQEITKEVYLKDELKQKDKLMLLQSRHAAMGEMISMIAHQWRQPLTNISMSVNNILIDMELESLTNEELKKQSDGILAQVTYLSNTIEDFRNFFRPNKEKESTTLKSVVDETLKIFNKALENNYINIEVVVEFDEMIDIYSRELLQVLINLIKNAKEALVLNDTNDKFIKISIFRKEDFIRLEVLDNAGGVSDDLKEKVFEPYFSTKDEKVGTGLGLYMSKTIVEKHLKGRLGVYNTESGACFYIDIPYKV